MNHTQLGIQTEDFFLIYDKEEFRFDKVLLFIGKYIVERCLLT